MKANITFVNLTKHDINEMTTGRFIPRGSQMLRTEMKSEVEEELDGIPVMGTEVGRIIGRVPPKKDNTIYIVSALALKSPELRSREDVVAPGPVVKDRDGIPIGCKGFKRA